MRKWLFLLFTLLLGGCGLLIRPEPAPSPTPRPTETLIPEVRYYPTAEPNVIEELRKVLSEPKSYYQEVTLPDGMQVKYYSLIVISSGEVDTLQTDRYSLDVVWVYERNRIVAKYPLVVGVQEGNTYFPYYVDYHGTAEQKSYFDYLQENKILERGRKLFPNISGTYVSRLGINWQSCGDTVFCRLGQYMQETYRLDSKVINRVMGWEKIPEGWALAWMWDAATDWNALPEYQKVNLP